MTSGSELEEPSSRRWTHTTSPPFDLIHIDAYIEFSTAAGAGPIFYDEDVPTFRFAFFFVIIIKIALCVSAAPHSNANRVPNKRDMKQQRISCFFLAPLVFSSFLCAKNQLFYGVAGTIVNKILLPVTSFSLYILIQCPFPPIMDSRREISVTPSLAPLSQKKEKKKVPQIPTGRSLLVLFSGIRRGTCTAQHSFPCHSQVTVALSAIITVSLFLSLSLSPYAYAISLCFLSMRGAYSQQDIHKLEARHQQVVLAPAMPSGGDTVNVAMAAVLVSSTSSGLTPESNAQRVQGSSNFHSVHRVLERYATTGFQATHFGDAMRILRAALPRQPRSLQYVVRDGDFVKVEPADQPSGDVRPLVFLGLTAQLLGTGCREAVVFLLREGLEERRNAPAHHHEAGADGEESPQLFGFHLFENLGMRDMRPGQVPDELATGPGSEPSWAPFGREERCDHHSFLSAVVVSGGGVEHDIRRACTEYHLVPYASETGDAPVEASAVTFGNVAHPRDGTSGTALFEVAMQVATRRLRERQDHLQRLAASKPIPADAYFDQCTWDITPSEVWSFIGLRLPMILAEAIARLRLGATAAATGTEEQKEIEALMRHQEIRQEATARARSTIVYWAAQQGVPLFSPSFVDGDIMDYLQPGAAPLQLPTLMLDLVRDIHSLNKMAMTAGRTAALICGGGVVKHHICNANLMRNGADFTVLMNSGQEFDGSDAGAKPEEAISWGKIRFDGEHVKVYGEVFVEAVRQRDNAGKNAAGTGRGVQGAYGSSEPILAGSHLPRANTVKNKPFPRASKNRPSSASGLLLTKKRNRGTIMSAAAAPVNADSLLELLQPKPGGSDHIVVTLILAAFIPYIFEFVRYVVEVLWPNALYWAITRLFLHREVTVVEEFQKSNSEELCKTVNNAALIDAISLYCAHLYQKATERERALKDGGMEANDSMDGTTIRTAARTTYFCNTIIPHAQFRYVPRMMRQLDMSRNAKLNKASRVLSIADILRHKFSLLVVPSGESAMEVEPGLSVRFEDDAVSSSGAGGNNSDNQGDAEGRPAPHSSTQQDFWMADMIDTLRQEDGSIRGPFDRRVSQEAEDENSDVDSDDSDASMEKEAKPVRRIFIRCCTFAGAAQDPFKTWYEEERRRELEEAEKAMARVGTKAQRARAELLSRYRGWMSGTEGALDHRNRIDFFIYRAQRWYNQQLDELLAQSQDARRYVIYSANNEMQNTIENAEVLQAGDSDEDSEDSEDYYWEDDRTEYHGPTVLVRRYPLDDGAEPLGSPLTACSPLSAIERGSSNFPRRSAGFDGLLFPQKEKLLHLLQSFENKTGFYAKPGVPDHLHLLITSTIRGTGTTSIVKAVARYLHRHVVVLSLGTIFTNHYLRDWLTGVRAKCANERRESEDDYYDEDSDEAESNVFMRLRPSEVVYLIEDIERVGSGEWAELSAKILSDLQKKAEDGSLLDGLNEPKKVKKEAEETDKEEEEAEETSEINSAEGKGTDSDGDDDSEEEERKLREKRKQQKREMMMLEICQKFSKNCLSVEGAIDALFPKLVAQQRVVILTSTQPQAVDPRWFAPFLLNMHIQLEPMTGEEVVKMMIQFGLRPTPGEAQRAHELIRALPAAQRIPAVVRECCASASSTAVFLDLLTRIPAAHAM
eukprot:gene11978-8251_t